MMKKDYKYVVVSRFYDNGESWATLLSLDNFDENDFPENSNKYDQYIDYFISRSEADSFIESVYENKLNNS